MRFRDIRMTLIKDGDTAPIADLVATPRFVAMRATSPERFHQTPGRAARRAGRGPIGRPGRFQSNGFDKPWRR